MGVNHPITEAVHKELSSLSPEAKEVSMRRIIGNMGLIGFEKNTIKLNLYVSILLFVLISIGVVCAVTYVINTFSPSSPDLQIAGAGDEGYRQVMEGKQ